MSLVSITPSAKIVEKSSRPELDKNVRLVALDDLFVAYIRTGGLSEILKSVRIEAAYNQLIKWSKARDLIHSDTRFIGFIPDNPETIPLRNADIWPVSRFRRGHCLKVLLTSG